MDTQKQVEITDRDGWRKAFPLDKPRLHIGSDGRHDIVLEAARGGGVAPLHLQLIAVPGEGQGYRAINLGDTDVLLGESRSQRLQPRSAVALANGDRFQVGDFSLVFRLGGGGGGRGAMPFAPSREAGLVETGRKQTSSVIGLSLSLPGSELAPEQPLEGVLTVQNLGNQPGVQFKLEVEHLDPDCYEIGPGPILFPNASKEVPILLHHPRSPVLPAGTHLIHINATAPEAYPGERATILQRLRIQPYYHHALRLVTVD